MVNNKHDAGDCDRSSYKHDIIFDGNALYRAFEKSKKNSDWKYNVQKFETSYLLGLGEIQRKLMRKAYQFSNGNTFTIHERGKERRITGTCIKDRIVEHVLCDEIVNPSIKKYIFYDNGASQSGKGVSFTRRRLDVHLQKYFKEHGSNDGYILLIDFSKYYDNMRHDVLKRMFRRYIEHEYAIQLIEQIIDNSRVDVSYMSDEQFFKCENGVFNSIEHDKIPKNMLSGEKYLNKHLNIGNQISQSAGIMYRTPIDNYIKVERGVKYYAAYMDDSYVIHESKEYLEKLLRDITIVSKMIGITINLKKTRICKLSDKWRFLQIQYSLSNTGKIIRKINPKNITRFRRKMKKLSKVLDEKSFKEWVESWISSNAKYMSKCQRKEIRNLSNILIKNKGKE